MIFFFQFDLLKRFDLPLKANSHLLVFMCPVHNDVPTQLLEPSEHELPENYWEKTSGHYCLCLYKPTSKEKRQPADSHIAEKIFDFSESEEIIDWDGRVERGSTGFKVGGVPTNGLSPRPLECACGAEMIFLCQVPEAYGFDRRKNAPVQTPDAVPGGQYNLFLGHPTYIYACKEQCTRHSVYALSEEPAEAVADSA
ncbi:MAG TPA: hypothetical protein V6D22_19500 [Candidatus Obscuribacterales bacterium]